MKVCAQAVWAEAVVAVQGAIVVPTDESTELTAVCASWYMLKSMALSIPLETSLKNAYADSPPRSVSTGAA